MNKNLNISDVSPRPPGKESSNNSSVILQSKIKRMKKCLHSTNVLKKSITLLFFSVLSILLLSSNASGQSFSTTWPFTTDLSQGSTSGNVSSGVAATAAIFTGTKTFTGSYTGTGISGKSAGSCSALFNSVGSTTPISPYMEFVLSPNAGYNMSVTTFNFTVSSSNAASGSSVSAGYSTDGGTTFTGLLAPSATAGTANASPIGSVFAAASATTFTFNVPACTVNNGKSFKLRIVIWRNNVSNSSGTTIAISAPSISGSTTCANPVIGTNPANATSCTNGSANFTAVATGSSLTYQWFEYNGSAWSSALSDGGIYSGSSTATLSLTNPAVTKNTYKYKCTVTSTCGATAISDGNATLTVNALPSVGITGSSAICLNGSSTLSPTTGGTWVSSSNSLATVTNGGAVAAVAAGSPTFTFTNTTTNCSATTGAITISALPSVSITGSTTINVGNTTTLSPASGGSWASNDVAVATVNSGSGIVTGAGVGSTTFTFTSSTAPYCANTTSAVTVDAMPASTISISNNNTPYTYNGSPKGPNTVNETGSVNTPTYSYVGVSGTTYGPSATQPTNPGSYSVTASVTSDGSYSAATSAPAYFTIDKAGSSVSPTVGTYTYSAAPQGPNSASRTGSTGAITFSYLGTGSTTYGPLATLPTAAGTYSVTASLAADTYYAAAISSAVDFTIAQASLSITPNNLFKQAGTSITISNAAFTTSGLFGSDAVTAVTLTSTGAASGAAIGTYPIVITTGSETGTGLNNYSIDESHTGTLTVGTQYTETFEEVCNTAGNATCFPSAGGLSSTATPLTSIGTWTAGGGGIGLVSPGIVTKSMKFHKSAVGGLPYAVTPPVHGVSNIAYTGLVGTLATNLKLSGNSALVYNNTIGTTNTTGSTAVTAADSIFTFTYSENATTSFEYLDNVVFTFATPATQASAASIPAAGSTGMSISWTRPNGGKDNQGAIVFVGDSATATWSNPSDGISYTANTAFGSGTQIASSGFYCVYNGNQSTVSITGLTLGHRYKVYVLEYNGIVGLSDENYNFNSPAIVTSPTLTSCVTPTLSGASQTGTTCVGSGATITLNGLVANVGGMVVSYTIDGGAVQTATGISSDGTGSANFISAAVTLANNGKTLQITQIADGSCSQTFTQNVTLAVDATTVPGTVASVQTICAGSAPADISLSGNTGSVVQWVSAPTAGFSSPTYIATTSTTLTSATMGSLSTNTYYRAIVKNGSCAQANSASVLITVNAASVGGTATYAGTDICSGNIPSASISLTGSTGAITWQKSTDATFVSGVSTVAGTGTSITAATIGTLTTTTYFRAVVTSGVCSSQNSSAATITVTQPSVGGTVGGGSTVCSGSEPTSDLTLSGNTGTISKWQSSTTSDFSLGVADITNTTNTLSASSIGALTATTYFRAVVTNGSCTSANSAAGTVVVNSPSFTTTAATAFAYGATVTYTTQTGETNYIWSFDGSQVRGTDYTITAGGTTSSNSITVQWLTAGTKNVHVNYTATGGCVSASAATTSTVVSLYATTASDYFKSNGTGRNADWNTPASWLSSSDGVHNWQTATTYVPTSSAASILILANDSITASVAVTVHNLTVNGTYVHNIDGGTIPAATWGSSSNCSVNGIRTGTTLAGLTQNFNNFTWNSASQTSGFQAASALTTVNGTLTIAATNSGTFRLTASNGTANNSNFGNIVITGGSFLLMGGGASSNNTSTVNVAGNVTLSGSGYLNLLGAYQASATTLNIGGNLSLSGTSYIDQSIVSTGLTSINFVKATGTQSLTVTSTNAKPIAGTRLFTINVGSVSKSPVLQLSSSVNLGLASLVIASNATLNIGANTLTTAAITATGKLIGSSSSGIVLNSTVGTASTLNFNAASNDSLLNSLTLSGTGKATLSTGLGITKLLSLNNSAAVLDINGHYLTMKSTSDAATAELGVVVTGAKIIDGTKAAPYTATKITVERYIPNGLRTFRDLGPTVYGAGSIFSNWQENGVYPTNYGMYITGKVGAFVLPSSLYDATTGFDYTTTGNPSVYTYTSGTWANLSASLGTKGTNLDPFQGVRTLIRGARNYNLNQQFPTMRSATTLRATGQLITGDVTFTTTGTSSTSGATSAYGLTNGADAYSFIANPYACPIDWYSIYYNNEGNNISSSYCYLDPTFLSSGYNVYITYNAVSNSTNNPAGSIGSREYIQPGQGFFVQNNSATSSPTYSGSYTTQLVISESDKVVGSTHTTVFGSTKPNLLAISLWKNNNGTDLNVDGAVAVFNSNFTKNIGAEDSKKMNNSAENISITETNNDLSIDGLPAPKEGDVVALKLGQVTAGTAYQLKVDASNYTGLDAYIHDALKNTEVPANSTVSFTPTTDAATYANRFSVVFKATKTMPMVNSGKLSVYPNPVTDKVVTILTTNIAAGKYNVTMINNMGQTVLTTTINHLSSSTTETIKMNKVLPSGVYTMMLKNTDGTGVYQSELLAK